MGEGSFIVSKPEVMFETKEATGEAEALSGLAVVRMCRTKKRGGPRRAGL